MIAYALISFVNKGDFVGYVDSANLLLDGKNIYETIYNTWPPVFSILSVPLAIINNFNYYLVRFLWMVFLFYCLIYSLKTTVEFIDKKTISYKSLFIEYSLKPWYVIALFLVCRSMMDNIMYMQINVPMLAVCLYTLKKQNDLKSGDIMGISIAAKVYNVFFIPLFILLRQWKSLTGIFLGLLLMFTLSIVVYGFENSIQLHQFWYENIASAKHEFVHRNQSLMASFHRLFNVENTIVNNQNPIIALKESLINYLFYLFLLMLASLYLFNFYKKILNPDERFIKLSIILVITAIPLLTPVAWKANYIYALPAIFYLIHSYIGFKIQPYKLILFGLSMFCLSFSAEVIVSRNAMYWLEKQNVLPIGQLILYGLLLVEMKLDNSKNHTSTNSYQK